MSVSEEAKLSSLEEERPTVDGQEAEVPSTATMRSQPCEVPTVPPEPCLEPRPPVVGAADTPGLKPQTQVPTSSKPDTETYPPCPQQTSIVPPQSHSAVPIHIRGGPGSGMSGSKISPLAQRQFAKPAPKPHPGFQGMSGQKLSPEQQEEAKLRSKYGKLNKPGGSDFLRMRLNKGGQKYFDSGDYNMAKSKGKIGLRVTPIVTKPGLPRPVEATTGDTIPTPASIPHKKTSSEISKLAV